MDTFNDPTLDRLVELAYQQNLPLQIAGLRIVEARAQLGVATGQQYPQIRSPSPARSAVGLSEHTARRRRLSIATSAHYQVGFDAAWELDFWGKYRRGVEAASGDLLAIGRRLRRRAGLAHRRGRAHLRRRSARSRC